MWTLNGKKVVGGLLSGIGADNIGITYTDITGEDIEVTYSGAWSFNGGICSKAQYKTLDTYVAAGKFALYVGSNGTPPTENDYTLDTVNLTPTQNPTLTRTETQTLIAFTLTNNTDSEQTIREVGLCTAALKTSSTYMCLLLNRKVLDTPVNMAIGDTYIFTFTYDTSNLTE